jgi:lysine 2,3-aminomutase
MSGVTVPRYAANVEGGGGKVLLMPSDMIHLIPNPGSMTRFRRVMRQYIPGTTKSYTDTSISRATIEEFRDGVNIMDRFIGRKGVFLPKLIIVDKAGIT